MSPVALSSAASAMRVGVAGINLACQLSLTLTEFDCRADEMISHGHFAAANVG